MVNIGMKEIKIYEQWDLRDISFLGGKFRDKSFS
jgi:hypothetical protein